MLGGGLALLLKRLHWLTHSDVSAFVVPDSPSVRWHADRTPTSWLACTAADSFFLVTMDSIQAFDATTGAARWTRTVAAPLAAARGVFAGPIPYQDDLLFVANGTLHAIAQSDGSDVWDLELMPTAQQDVAHGNPSLVLVGSDLVALVGSKLFVISPDKRRINAERPISAREGTHYRLLADGDAVIMFIGRDVACYALGSLEPQWRLSDAVDLSRADRAAMHDSGLYFDSRGFFADTIQKIDVDSGELAWSHKTVVSIESSFGFYKNQVLFAGSSHLVAVDSGSGLETWRVELSRSLNRQGHGEIAPTVVNGACFLVAEDPEAIMAVDLKSRQELWTCPITLGEFCFVDGPPRPAGQDLLIIAASGANCHFVAAIGGGSGDVRLAKASD